MLLNIIKSFFSKTKVHIKKIFLLNLIFLSFYFLLFFTFSIFRFSEILANILKITHFYILYFFAVPSLIYISDKNNMAKNFMLTVKAYSIRSFIFAFLFSVLNLIGIFLMRFAITKKAFSVAGFVFFVVLFFTLSFAHLPAILSWEIDKKISFSCACKESFNIFIEQPFITFVLFLISLIFRLIAIYSLFVLPTWILGDFIFFISKSFLNVQTQ